MPFTSKRAWTDDEVDASIVLLDTLLFPLLFWKDDLTIPNDRLDLPRSWAGTQLISKEQRLMFLDGGDYAILRDVIPEITLWSPRKVALRTSRKIAKTVHFEALWVQIAAH